MTLLTCRGFLFDMDGVLVDSHAVVERTWRKWALRHDMDPEPIIAVAHGRRSRDTMRDIAPHLDVEKEVAWLDATERKDMEGVVALPGAVALLTHLPGVSWVIVTSSGDALARERLTVAGLPIPRKLIASERISKGKPDPEGYLAGAKALGIPPEECIVFEDAPPGVQAGLAAGSKVVGLATTYPADRLTAATRVVKDLSEVHIGRAGPLFHVLLGG
jgi:mannitol-1-/sugar-/sorbitol-6-phosphatase